MPPDKKGFDFYNDVLGAPRYVVAPMVDASELAWRQLGRKYGAELCYTPMFHAGVFVKDVKYRKEAIQTCPEDRPLIMQFCANDPKMFLEACRLASELIDCQAFDLNLGCPQIIARRGHFGAYLQDEWDLIHNIISLATAELDVPITAKCRVFPDPKKSIQYAQMLEKAGAQLITVHGRTRDQKGPLTGLADWDQIKAIREVVKVPMFANGNIQYLEDADRCIKETGVQGVMSAEGHLTNPALFAGVNPTVWDISEEYLDLVDKYPCPLGYVRGHMFKILMHLLKLKENFDVREKVAKAALLTDFREAIATLKAKYIDYHTGLKEYEPPEELKIYNLKFPPWICQPYVRPPPEEYLEKLKKIQDEEHIKRRQGDLDSPGENGMSKKQKKRMEKNQHKMSKKVEYCQKCVTCGNPSGLKCCQERCRKCCVSKAYKENLDCPGHKVFIKTNREKARSRPPKAENGSDAEKPDKMLVDPVIEPDTLENGGDLKTVMIDDNNPKVCLENSTNLDLSASGS